MLVNEFNYNLPEELIAQTPLDKRSESRLLICDRKNNKYYDKHFYDIVDYLDSNDVLVLNNTKVLPSRIFGEKVDTKAKIELLLLKEVDNYWEVLVRPFRRVHVGTVINFGDLFTGRIIKKLEDGLCQIEFKYDGVFLNLLEQLGQMPLPPYIHERLNNDSRYQTIYAKTLGSAAAPTAGLHFDNEVFSKLKDKGAQIAYVTLHIGLGTFRSVSVENVEEHQMHSEFYYMDQATADLLNKAKENGRRIISVGTTTTRTLESIYNKYKMFKEVSEETNIFIYPPYKFKAVDALITNFHLPKSTLLMLVSAFYSKEKILEIYKHAIEEKYRFFSFGDAMFII